MPELLAFAGIVGALAIGVVSPGPSFVMVAREAVSVSRSNGVAAAIGMGLGGAMFASAFAAFVPGRFSPAFAIALLCVVFALETGWYAIVAALLSSDASRRVYLGYKVWADRSAGLIMMALGLRLIGIAGRN